MAAVDVLPKDISLEPKDSNDHAFSGFFGKFEMDIFARLIVTLMAKENVWRPFHFEEIEEVNEAEVSPEIPAHIRIGLQFLELHGWLTPKKRGYFEVSEEFIRRCKQESDARLAPAST